MAVVVNGGEFSVCGGCSVASCRTEGRPGGGTLLFNYTRLRGNDLHTYLLSMRPLTCAIPAFVAVVWVRKASSLTIGDEKPQCLYRRLLGKGCRR
jgi:hypothetical protein